MFFIFFSILNTILEIVSLFFLINLLFIIAEIETSSSWTINLIQSYVSGNPVLYSTILMLSIVLIKFVFQTTYSYQQEKYGYIIQKKISQNFKNIINVEYLEYLKLNL